MQLRAFSFFNPGVFTSATPPELQMQFDATQGQSGFYTYGSAPAVATWIDQTANARDATQSNASLRPDEQTNAINTTVTAMKFTAAANDRFNIQNALTFLHQKTGVLIRFPYMVASAPTGTDVLCRFETTNSSQGAITVQLLSTMKIRVSVRLVAGVSAQNFDSIHALTAGVPSVIRIHIDTTAPRVRIRIDHLETILTPVVLGVPGWDGGETEFDISSAGAAPTIFRSGNSRDGLMPGFEMWTGRFDEVDDEDYWLTWQALLASPRARVSLDTVDRAHRNFVNRARPGATVRITGGTASAGVNKIDDITVDGDTIMSAAVDWVTSNNATATAVAANINGFTATSGYRATASDSRVIIESVQGGLTNNGLDVVVTPAGDVTVEDDTLTTAMGSIVTMTGTVLEDMPNGAVKIRLLKMSDTSVVGLDVYTIIELTTGSTSVERAWSSQVFIPRGSWYLEARLGADPVYNAVLSTQNQWSSGLRILWDGQSNGKNMMHTRATAGVYPLTVTPFFYASTRNTGDGHWDLSAVISGGGGTFVETNEAITNPLNAGMRGNGFLRMIKQAVEVLNLDYPIGFSYVTVGSSGSDTRLPGAVNYVFADGCITSTGSGGYDFDAYVITDGEEDANQHYANNVYRDNEKTTIAARRVLCGEQVPVFLSLMGPTITEAEDEDPDMPNYTYADRVKRQQMVLVRNIGGDGLTDAYWANNPMDTLRAEGDLQHGAWDRYEDFGVRILYNILNVYDPATYTTNCQGPIADSMTIEAGTNTAVVTFLQNNSAGTGLTGKATSTNFTGMRIMVNGTFRTITASSASGWVVTLTFSGAAASAGHVGLFEFGVGNEVDASNILMDNWATKKTCAQPTYDPIEAIAE